MKRTISLWLGLLAFALLPALAQTPAPNKSNGKIHGHVTNPTGAPQSGGTVSVQKVGVAVGPGVSAKHTEVGSFPVDANGDYSGEFPSGSYNLIYRAPGLTDDKVTDSFEGVKIFAGQETVQDFDMSRKEYIDALPADQRKQLEDLKKRNAAAIQANEAIKNLNADLKLAAQDLKDADTAAAAATQALGATASRSDLDAKETEIKVAKYTDVETMMLRDTAAKPDASVLWAQLGQAQLGLARAKRDQQKYDAAEAAFKKVLEVEAASKKPNPSTQGAAESGLGEIYARTGKVPEANAAYDAAVKINPTQAAFYLKNETVIFFQVGNGDAQVAAAEEAIKADPSQPLPYYLKGQGLIQKATIDSKTGKMVLPDGCAEAYQKYLTLAPDGIYAGEVKAILTEASQTHNTSVSNQAPPKKKK
jgi:tetratricopeptide (TPR) repeat protein